MGIFRQIELSWNGKDYKCDPSMVLLRRIERGRPGEGPVSIIQVMAQSAQGNPQISIMAQIIEEVMWAAGATDFSGEEIYQAFYHGDADQVVALWQQVIAALSPVPKEQKKSDVPDKK